jgi:NCAIR mutase (PurE)-related protein
VTEPPSRVEDVAELDHDRRRRTGVPEVVFGQGKTTEQTLGLLAALRRADPSGPALATRCPPEVIDAAGAAFPGESVTVDPVGRTVVVGELPTGIGRVVVVTAGTVDLPVAHECATTLRVLGVAVDLVPDVGVAGLHRLLGHLERLRRAHVVIVVAGMDGALPSVVAGLIAAPVIGVPTGVGYGVAAGGVAAATSMLSSCSPGLVVVNIDNGFGAAVHAAKIERHRADEA